MKIEQLKKISGFTLAEILLTLTVIGVVSALTMPVLTNNYQKSTYTTSLRKIYTQVEEAVDREMTAYDTNDFRDTPLLNGTTADPNAFFKKYFKVAKFCGSDFEACFDTTKSFDKSKSLNPADCSDRGGGCVTNSVILKDGASLAYIHFPSNKNKVPFFLVDINGKSKPATSGRDVFSFNVYYNGSVGIMSPGELAGADANDRRAIKKDYCNDPKNIYGMGCLLKIIDAGWKMDY